ncbi:MAG: four helix bundle protein [Planctomycetota bacterium]
MAVDLPSYLLPSTRSTLYFLLSTFYLLSRLFWLVVYQKSVDFADLICATTEGFQRGYGFLVDQLNRAELSISSNIAKRRGLISESRHTELKLKLEKISRMLSGLINGLEDRRGAGGSREWRGESRK